MDHFGIGAAMASMTTVYLHAARRTGRTMSLVESVKDGDRIVFADSNEARRVERLLEDRGVQVACIVVPVEYPKRIFERPPSEGRTIFDHTWVEHFYAQAIKRAQKEIDHFERESSGFGVAHRETRRRAEELTKWPR